MVSWSDDDYRYMARAIQLAEKGRYSTHPNPRVGCILVNNGKVVGEGFHEQAGSPHAEVNALLQAGSQANGATVYVTLEPCSHHGRTPPCADALIGAGAARVVAAMRDPNPLVAGKGLERLRKAGVSVDSGLLEDQALALNEGFVSRMSRSRPFVRLKMATSIDGRTAMASGESQWITGSDAREDVQHWRAQSSAVLSGIGTIKGDNPKLTVRSASVFRQRKKIQPTRVLLDAKAQLSGDEQVFEANASVIYFVGENAGFNERIESMGHAVVIRLPLNHSKRFDLPLVLNALAEQEINDLFVEVGASLAGDFIAQDCVDELLLYMAPKIMGSNGLPTAMLPFESMSESILLECLDMRFVGQDMRLRYRIKER